MVANNCVRSACTKQKSRGDIVGVLESVYKSWVFGDQKPQKEKNCLHVDVAWHCCQHLPTSPGLFSVFVIGFSHFPSSHLMSLLSRTATTRGPSKFHPLLQLKPNLHSFNHFYVNFLCANKIYSNLFTKQLAGKVQSVTGKARNVIRILFHNQELLRILQQRNIKSMCCCDRLCDVFSS